MLGVGLTLPLIRKKNNSAALRDKRLVAHEISCSECYQPML